MLNREIIQNQDEKEFVTSLIMSDKCCQVLIPYIKLNYFDIDYTRTVVSWVMDYYKKFRNSPKQDIISVYRSRCDEIQDDALKELVLNYIQELGKNEIAINNEDYLVDKCKDFIDYKAMEIYTEEIQSCLDTKNMDKARQIQSEYRKVSTVKRNEVDLMSLQDCEKIENALNEEEEVLFTLPGAMNDVFGKIHRNDFISLLAPPKRGKSWLLQYIAIQAMKQRLNVILVSMEMTVEENIRRMWKTMFGAESGLVKDGLYESCKFVEDSSEQGKYRCELIDVKVNNKAQDVSALQKRLRMNNNYTGTIKILAYPTNSVTVERICDDVKSYAEDGFVADVVLIDYVNITKKMPGKGDAREKLDEMWLYLRGFASQFHCALITAAQTNRMGASSSIVGSETIGENFKEIAHVTSMVSMERTKSMKNNHIMRLRNIAVRNDKVSETCVFPQCLDLGQFVFGEPILGENLIIADDEDNEDDV